jgi:hypothetical protein
MKKEYLILLALILILSAYLMFHKENKDNYTLPQIAKIDTQKITGLTIYKDGKKDEPIIFTKTQDKWIFTDKEYIADSYQIENMLDTFKKFRLTALVSQKDDLKRYELDDEKSIRVKVQKNAETIFEFTMGKTAPTFNHTFVMLENNKNVYHANGSFRSYFENSIDDFRDKSVMEFKEESIKQIIVEMDGLSKTLIAKDETQKKETPEGDTPKESTPKEDTPKENISGKETDNQEIITSWIAKDGTMIDKEAVSNILSSTASLNCENFLEDADKKELENTKPLCTIKLADNENYTLTLFKKPSQENYSGISSMNKYAFEISKFNGDQIISSIEKLLVTSK